MNATKRDAAKAAPSSTLKHALLILSGAASMGYVSAANAQATAKPEGLAVTPKVSVDKVARPKNKIVKTPQSWQRVVIELTPEQKAQLAKQGVQTDKLSITTYNIQNLAADMIN